jgi:extracellular elastinolytic metalloproteinase
MGTLGISADNVVYKSGFTDGSARYAYVKQTIVRSCHSKNSPIIDIFGQDGIPLANGVGNVAFNGDKVVSYGSSFVDTKSGSL